MAISSAQILGSRLRRAPSERSGDATPRRRVTFFGPNWFASVMGTGIVATAGASLPVHVTGVHTLAVAVWIVAAALLFVVAAMTTLHWLRDRDVARSHGRDANMSHFYGALPMALLTVGAGAVLAGASLIGMRAAVDLDWVLWIAGTAIGLGTAVVMPYRLFTQIEVPLDGAFGGWLMPIVPPMVSASTGALLIPHVASQTGRATLLYGCYAMFGLSLLASFIVITLIWSRLAHHGIADGARVPTWWIVLGPLGQSITAAGLLGADAHLAVAPHVAGALDVFAIVYGVPTWGFALLWLAIAASITVRTVRNNMPFALTWWSFTFPVGTLVTGTTRMADATHLPMFQVAALVGYVGLLGAWLLVATRTAQASRRGDVFRPPLAGASAPAAQDEVLLPVA